MIRELRAALVVFALLTLITGVLYPGLVTVVGRLVFPEQATGSILMKDGHAVGSRLLGQPFSDPRYFWSRPSATGPQPYNGAVSSGSNLAATNPALEQAVGERVAMLRAANPRPHPNRLPQAGEGTRAGEGSLLSSPLAATGESQDNGVPVDLVTASGSGLDPHISPAAAEYQVGRVARERGLEESKVRSLVKQATEGRTFGILGEPRVNVLELNLALDALR